VYLRYHSPQGMAIRIRMNRRHKSVSTRDSYILLSCLSRYAATSVGSCTRTVKDLTHGTSILAISHAHLRKGFSYLGQALTYLSPFPPFPLLWSPLQQKENYLACRATLQHSLCHFFTAYLRHHSNRGKVSTGSERKSMLPTL
jgi:hypothetical protein